MPTILNGQTPLRRIGFVAPLSNTMCEQEFNALATPGVSFHAARMGFGAGPREGDVGAAMLAALQTPFEDLALCDPAVVVLACSSASIACDRDAVRALVAARTDAPFIDVIDAAEQALKHVGGRRIALFSPFVEAGNRAIAAAFVPRGLEVVAARGLGLNTSPERFRQTSRLTNGAIRDGVLEMDLGDADAVLLACCDMPSIGVIGRLEQDLGQPVVSMIQAIYWAAMRALGQRPSAAAPGRLFAATQPVRRQA